MANNKFMDFFKSVYNKAYLFIGVQLFAFIIIFFVLDEESGGSYMARIIYFPLLILIGGGITAYIAKKNDGDLITAFRRGAGALLIFVTLISWANNGYTPSSSGGSFSNYPKACKAGCGYEITSSTYDCDGYHCTCVPGKDGESAYDKARRY